METFDQSEELKNFFKVIAYSIDDSGKKYVAALKA